MGHSKLKIMRGDSALVMFELRLGLMRSDVIAFGIFPFVLWGAIRFEAAGAAFVSFLISAIAILRATQGLGPLTQGNPFGACSLIWEASVKSGSGKPAVVS